MSRDEWYRRTTWSEADRDDFNTRLNRCRSTYAKSQHLRIQAWHLAAAGRHLFAIELLDRLFAEFPERSQMASAHLQKAESLASLGQTEFATHEFRSALQAEREFPNVRTNAWLDFAWFVVGEHLSDRYNEILEVLDEFSKESSSMSFPIDAYRYWAVKAVVANFHGDEMAARESAKHALSEAAKTHSGFRYHAILGLVGSQSKTMEETLTRLAGH